MKIPSSYIINTAKESRALDSETTQSFGIDAFTLMEIAGFSAGKIIRDKVDNDAHGLFLCGKGNNGGDALVTARYLVQHDIFVTILFVAGTDELSPLVQKNYDLLQKIKQNDSAVTITFIEGWENFANSVPPDFIIDGMLGTGLNSNLRGEYVDAVQWANSQNSIRFVMDIPTGLHADTGKVMGNAIHASYTFAFGTLKQGFYLNEGYKYRGKILFCELPFPNYLNQDNSAFLIDENWLPKKNRGSSLHKYEAGVVYLIGGSEGLTGAAILAARSAWAEGVGAVILLCPKGILSAFENNLPQIIKKPIGERDDVYFKEEHFEEVSQIVQEKKGVTLIGPGLGRQETTVQFVNIFLGKNKTDCIIDADALWALSKKNGWQKPKDSSWILTPHLGELHTLLDTPVEDDTQRLKQVKKIAREENITILSKGFPVIVGTPEGKIYLSGYDNRSFSRAGFGDVLAGKISAYSAVDCSVEESCLRGLLKGKERMIQLKNQKLDHIPEPLDFI